MADGINGGISSRLDRLERENSDIFRRLGALERMIAALPFIREDIAEIKESCKATQEWVEGKIQERHVSEAEDRRLSAGQKWAIIGAVGVVAASLFTAIATLISAGAFG